MSTPLTLIGIDPGTTDCGVSAYSCDPETLELICIESYTLIASKIFLPVAEDIVLSHSERFANIKRITHAFKKLLKEIKPHTVACESPFFHRLHPGAFAPLVEVIFSLRDAVYDYNRLVPFMLYEPIYIKRAFTGKAFADKNLMKTTLVEHSEIRKVMTQDLEKLSEHAIDATAIGWTHLQTLRNAKR